MITVNHYANDEWSVTGIAIDRNVLAKSLYHYGHATPNYPMPAPLGVSITANYLQRSYWMAGTLAWDTIRP